jgi:hypothetical protein
MNETILTFQQIEAPRGVIQASFRRQTHVAGVKGGCLLKQTDTTNRTMKANTI